MSHHGKYEKHTVTYVETCLYEEVVWSSNPEQAKNMFKQRLLEGSYCPEHVEVTELDAFEGEYQEDKEEDKKKEEVGKGGGV